MARDAKLKKFLLPFSCLSLYIIFSVGMIFFNKWILSSSHFNFPFPVSLTLLHMVFSSILCFLIIRVFKFVENTVEITLSVYCVYVIPISIMFAMTLWLGNTTYLYISVSFAQMLKAIMPVTVYALGVSVGLEMLSWQMMCTMLLISTGVIVASYGEVSMSWTGVLYQMGGVIGESGRLILIEMLLKHKGLRMNPLCMLYYVAPCSAFCLFLTWLFLEKDKILSFPFTQLNAPILLANSLCTFGLNVSVFLTILHTSALTMRIASVIKDWMVVVFSAIVFSDIIITPVNMIGYGVAIFGVYLYNRQKLNYNIEKNNALPKTSQNNINLDADK